MLLIQQEKISIILFFSLRFLFQRKENVSQKVLKFETKKDEKDEKESEEEFFERYYVDTIIQRAHKATAKYMLVIGTELTDINEICNIVEQIFSEV